LNKAEQSAGGLRHRHVTKTSLFQMWLRLAAILIVALVATLACGRANAQKLIQISGAEHTVMVMVPIGKSQDVRTGSNFADITVGDPEVADVNPLTDHSLSILGKKIGTTRVSVYGPGKTMIGIFDVEVSYDISRLTNELKRRFPGSRISASSVNGRIMLSGEASDAAMLDAVVTIARQFGPEIINAVSVMSPQQVLLEVRFIELSRTAGREFGVQWNRFGGSSTANIGSRQSASNLPIAAPPNSGTIPAGEIAAGVLSGASPFGFVLARIAGGGALTDVAINALEQKGVARSLAEPNLVALSGDTASFLAGGEYPIPVAGQLGQITVDYKKYGIGLAFTPTVLSRGLINIKIEPEVSQIDTNPNHTVAIAGGITIPALTVRRASTTVELRDGQSFAIGGLLQSDNQHTIEQLPWAGNVPVLGALFSSKSYQNNQTDLVIIVTPHIVRPARPGDVIKAPTDDTVPPNDADFFLLGKTELTRKQAQRLTPLEARIAAAGGQADTGHMLDLNTRKEATDATVQ
jgi:pilus assembly protein CpaC